MRLDGRLAHTEVEGDLLVEQTLTQHLQHAHLLGGERRESRGQVGDAAPGASGRGG